MLFESIILPSVTIKIGGKVKKAIDAYRQKKVPMRVMLTDYLAVKSKADLLAEAENPWAYNYKGIEGHEVESGVSHEETLFRFSAMELKNQEPSDVIEAAFYANKKRNDSSFELGYLLPLFKKIIKETDKILIVNPSPRMVCTIEDSGHRGDRYYAVTDETVRFAIKNDVDEESKDLQKSSVEILSELKKLLDAGLISQEQYDDKVKEVLSRMLSSL